MTPAQESCTAGSAPGDLTRPHQPRHPAAHPTWRPSEQWVWQRLCEGAIADFNARDEKVLDPSNPTAWDDTRTVSTIFLETVLLQEPYHSALPRQGVRIVGARFEEVFALEHARLGHMLWLDCTRFEQEVQLSGLNSTNTLSLEGSYFARTLKLSGAQIEGRLVLRGARCTGLLDMEGLKVEASLFMDTVGSQTAQFAKVVLRSAQIGGELVLRGARCTGPLDMNGLKVEASLLMDTVDSQTAQFAEVVLRSARIGRQLVLDGTRCTGLLDMEGLKVETDLFMRTQGSQTAQFAEVVLRGAQIGGQLSLRGACCIGLLDMEGLKVERDLFIHTQSNQMAQFAEVNLPWARVGGQFVLRGARCTGPFNLTGASIQGEFHLGESDEVMPRWKEDARLILRNATVGAIQCPPGLDAWPALELGGFTYKQLGGFSPGDHTTEMATRPPAWFVQWLEKDRTFSPQPYHQLANVLRSMGHIETADAVLYTGKERERRAAGWWKWGGMSLLKWTIGYGYGYRYFYALWWVVGITLIGALILGTTLQGPDFTLIRRLAYSFDLLLPIVELDKRHSLEGIDGWPRYYFYVHELLGYVLGSFIVAGLAGLTKK
jgi:hypothetical protein